MPVLSSAMQSTLRCRAFESAYRSRLVASLVCRVISHTASTADDDENLTQIQSETMADKTQRQLYSRPGCEEAMAARSVDE